MKHLWVVNHYATEPSSGASGSRHHSLCRTLATLGWAPTIFAAASQHNAATDARTEARTGEKTSSGVRFRFLAVPSYHGNGPGRILNMVAFAATLLLPRSTAGLAPPDAVIGSTVHPLAAWSAYRLARRHRVPFLFEIRDLWPQTLIDLGAIRDQGVVARILRYIERVLCRRATRIITLLPFADEYLSTIGVHPDKVVWISNGTDVVDSGPPTAPPDGDFTFAYLGSMGAANGLHTLIDAFGRHAREVSGTRLKLVGAGPDKSRLVEAATRLGLGDRVSFHDPVPKVEVAATAAASHCLVVNLLDLQVYRYGISLNKLFDYMAAARPIIIATSARNNPVGDADAGLTVRADDAEEIARAMSQMARADDADRSRWGRNALRHVAGHYDYAHLGRRLDAVLGEAVSASEPRREMAS